MSIRWFAVLAFTLTVACRSTTPYQMRGTEEPLQPAPDFTVDKLERSTEAQLNLEARSVEKFDELELGVLEITDDGLVNPTQKQQVFDLVRERISKKQSSLLVVFIHGWHHGPRVCDRDLCCFRRVLHRLATAPRLDNAQVHVTGVYIGWRGESLHKPWNAFTLWNRKNVAQHIGRTGAKEILLELDRLYSEVEAADPAHHRTMVTVGHSLGGALVFSAMKGLVTGDAGGIIPGSSPTQTYRVVRAEGDREEAKARGVKAVRARLGDLVVLVNPAIEADEYKAFHADLPDSDPGSYRVPPDKTAPYAEEQLPVLMAVASKADAAVGKAFVAGRWVSAFRYPSIARDPAERIAIGHYRPHITHEVDYRGPVVATRDENSAQCGCSKLTDAKLDAGTEDDQFELTTTAPQKFGQLEFNLMRDKSKWDVHSPYLVVSASPRVISEHSDIYNPVFVEFLTKYIRGYYARSLAIQQKKGTVAAAAK